MKVLNEEFKIIIKHEQVKMRHFIPIHRTLESSHHSMFHSKYKWVLPCEFFCLVSGSGVEKSIHADLSVSQRDIWFFFSLSSLVRKWFYCFKPTHPPKRGFRLLEYWIQHSILMCLEKYQIQTKHGVVFDHLVLAALKVLEV